MLKINVVAGILRDRDNRILIARRNPDKTQGGKWEFPGGKVEMGELPAEALERELNEEFGIQTKTIKYLGRNEHQYEEVLVNLIAYESKLLSGELRLTDHDEIAWVRVNELIKYDLAPADIPLIRSIKEV